MADFPALPLWTDAYLADTRHLSRDEHGAYLLLMMEAWRRPRCCLPDDDALLARLTCSTPEEWARVKPVVMAFWTYDANACEWTQKRLRKEHQYVTQKRAKNRASARKRWEQTTKDDANAHANALPSQSERNAPTPTPLKNPPTPQGGGRANGHSQPRKPEIDAAFDRFWAAYPRHETKAKAREKLELILKRHEATADELASAAASYASRMQAEGRPREKIAHPTTWLNQKRWLDEAEHQAQPRASPAADLSPEQREHYEELARQRQKERQH